MQEKKNNLFISSSNMKKFRYRLIKFLFPIIIIYIGITFIYLITDPFKVLYSYESYSELSIIPNRDFVSTETFLKNYKNQNYNSFIFGSSRTMAFNPKGWQNYLPKNANPFSFDASGETLFGMEKKISFLDELDVSIENVLLVICPDITLKTTTNSLGHIYIKDPRTSKENKIAFHLQFLKSFFNTDFLYAFLKYKVTGKIEPFMYNYIEERKIQYHPINNHLVIMDKEEEINNNEYKYYSERKDIFDIKSDSTQYQKQIEDPQIKLLESIQSIFQKHNTNYKVIISPLYNKIKISEVDLRQLEKIFGSKNVFDFSGINEFTLDRTNYYEQSHYRPKLGNRIMERIYSN